jgi:hypothetical protein
MRLGRFVAGFILTTRRRCALRLHNAPGLGRNVNRGEPAQQLLEHSAGLGGLLIGQGIPPGYADALGRVAVHNYSVAPLTLDVAAILAPSQGRDEWPLLPSMAIPYIHCLRQLNRFAEVEPLR